jgi:hypothetical protein
MLYHTPTIGCEARGTHRALNKSSEIFGTEHWPAAQQTVWSKNETEDQHNDESQTNGYKEKR